MQTWKIDPSPDTVKAGRKALKVNDVYTQWLLNWGAKFRPSVDNARQSPDDFGFYVRSRKLTKAKRPRAIAPAIGPVSNAKSAMISLLPIAANAVPSGPTQKAGHVPADLALDADKLVIIGVIDDGVNVFNRRFRPKGRASKIEYAWVQDGPAPTNGTTVPFGFEMTGQDITNAIDSGKSERALLVENGFSGANNDIHRPDVFAHASNHGTQIADLAAGGDDANTRLITVQLPAYSVMDTSGASLISAMHHAAIYVFERARAISAKYLTPIPVVLNISFGLTGGARNGQQFLERALRALAIKYREDMRATFGDAGVPPVVRVVSAGNENILGLHAQSLDADSFDLPLRLQPEDSTASFLEIWLPQSASSAEIDIVSPNGIAGQFNFTGLDAQNIANFDAHVLSDDPNLVVCRATLDAPMRPSDDDNTLFWRVVIAFAPTKSTHGSAAAGLWNVSVTTADISKNMHAWILRDEAVSGFASNGRQAYFDDDHLQNSSYDATSFDPIQDIAVDDPAVRSSVIARNGAISGLATNSMLRRKNGGIKKGDGPEMDAISVGAYRWDQPFAAMYSAADITGNGQAPHVMAIAETSRVLPNIRTTGLTSDTSAALNGTSAAAPIVTRIMADCLSQLSRADYAAFDPKTVLQSMGVAPARPVDREVATDAAIRVERLRDGGVLLPLPAALQANASRDSLAKT